ncbi:hypothetical protein NLU13_7741 [Sarocladium strictum]|uniref:Uncharacterized protein n=1 Tax=Sarocladium strictum TaxID=5046 RepID=A0AA39L610_SARSR|nr:hypothetical protein NLU13_7741 [Sarocladium strictum]
MDNLTLPPRPPTPQVLIHRLPDKASDSAEPAQKPSKYIILIAGPISVPGKVQLAHSVARALSCPSYNGDSVHSSSAKVAGVGAGADAGPNEARYQRMWLKKMTRTGLLFPEESRPATEDFSGFGGESSSTATSRRGSASSVSSVASNARPPSVGSSNREDFVPGSHASGDAPSSVTNTFFTISEEERLRRANPALMVLTHPELEPWHKVAIRTALRDYLIGVIFVPLYEEEEEEEDLPILQPLDPTMMTSLGKGSGLPAARPRGWGNLDEEMVVRIAPDADVDGKLQHIVDGVRDLMGIDE